MAASHTEEREQQLTITGLSRYTKTQLLSICETIGIPAPITAPRTEIIVVLMREAGYKIKKAPEPAQKKERELTPEELEWMLYTWLQDEMMLLKAIANGLNDIIVLRDLNTKTDPATGRATTMPITVLRQRLAETLEQLRYYQASSNLKSMVGVHHIINPHAKLDF